MFLNFRLWLEALDKINVISTSKAKKEFSLPKIEKAAWSTQGYRNNWMAYAFVASKPYWKPSMPFIIYDTGWNQSFHAAQFTDPVLIAFAPTPKKAHMRLKKALEEFHSSSIQTVDPSVEKFQRRRLVRSGD